MTAELRSYTFLARLHAGGALGFTEPEDQLKESIVEASAQLAVVLPEGVPWTSASGVLLAPEPGAGLLAAAAIATLARVGRRAQPSR